MCCLEFFRSDGKGILGLTKAVNHKDLVQVMFTNFYALVAGMRVKKHCLLPTNLFHHLDKFLEKLGDISKEQGKRFHNIYTQLMEERYQRRWDIYITAEWCWSLMRDFNQQSHKRKSNK